jgi:hypothetical protein
MLEVARWLTAVVLMSHVLTRVEGLAPRADPSTSRAPDAPVTPEAISR